MSATMITAAIATIATVDAARITRALLSGEPGGETDRSLRIARAGLREMRAREPNARAGGLASSHSLIDTLPRRLSSNAGGGQSRLAGRDDEVRGARRASFVAPRGHG